jgi:hypothetical protein
LCGGKPATFDLQLAEQDPTPADDDEVGKSGLGAPRVVGVVDEAPERLGQLAHGGLEVTLSGER